MGQLCCPETWVRNYHYSLRNISQERSSQLLREGNLMSRMLPLSVQQLGN